MSEPATRAKDAGAEYAEIWGETLHTNRHLRVISVGLGIGLLLLIVVVIRIVSVDPPRPIVVRVDEVGRGRGRRLRGDGGPGGSARPHHQILPQSLHSRLLLAAAGPRSRRTGPALCAS